MDQAQGVPNNLGGADGRRRGHRGGEGFCVLCCPNKRLGSKKANYIMAVKSMMNLMWGASV